MSEAGEFIDRSLQNEGSWERASGARELDGSGLRFYGASMGAIRGTVRDAARKFPSLDHDEIAALSSELWAEPVYERRLAAIVLLQANVRNLKPNDLTRIEGFVRSAAGSESLLGHLIDDVVLPLFARFESGDRLRTDAVLTRWAESDHPALRRAALAVSDL